MDDLEEMDKFLERYNLPRLNQEETENMNRPITSNETETVIKDLPTAETNTPLQSNYTSIKMFKKKKIFQ